MIVEFPLESSDVDCYLALIYECGIRVGELCYDRDRGPFMITSIDFNSQCSNVVIGLLSLRGEKDKLFLEPVAACRRLLPTKYSTKKSKEFVRKYTKLFPVGTMFQSTDTMCPSECGRYKIRINCTLHGEPNWPTLIEGDNSETECYKFITLGTIYLKKERRLYMSYQAVYGLDVYIPELNMKTTRWFTGRQIEQLECLKM